MEIQQAVENNPLLELEDGAEDFSADDLDGDADGDMELERDDALDDLVEGTVETDSEWDPSSALRMDWRGTRLSVVGQWMGSWMDDLSDRSIAQQECPVMRMYGSIK